MRRNCAAGVPGDLNCGLSARHPDGRAPRRRAATRSRSSRRRPSRRTRCGRSSSSRRAPARRARASSRSVTSRSAIPAVYSGDRLFVALRIGDDAAFDSSIDALEGCGASGDRVRPRGQVRPRGGVLPVGVRDRCRRCASRHRSVRRAERQGIEGQHQRGAAAVRADRRAARRDRQRSPTARCACTATCPGAARPARSPRTSTPRNPGDYVALMAYVTPDDGQPRARCSACASPSATRGSSRPRSGSGLDSCTAPASCTRAVRTPASTSRSPPTTGPTCRSPAQPFTFSMLKRAQAAGDLQSLRDHGRRVVRVHIAGDLGAGLASLTDAVSAITAAR